MLGLDDAERAAVGVRLGEAVELVGAAGGRVEQHRLRMPRVALERARRRVVAGDGDDVRFFLEQDRQCLVEVLDCPSLGLEVTVLAVHVGVLVVDEKIFVVVVQLFVFLELLLDRLRALVLGHADELGEALVHRINSEARGAHGVAFGEQRDVRLMCDAAHEEAVGRLQAGEQRQGGLVKLADQLGGLFCLGAVGVVRLRLGDRQAFAVRVGVAQRPGQAGSAKDDDEAVALARRDDDFGVADLLDVFSELGAALFAKLSLDATGAPVGDQAIGVESAEVSTGGNVARLQLQSKAKRLDDAATDLNLERIVAKQPEVAGAAAGRDAVRRRDQPAQRGVLGQDVEVGGGRRLERGLVIRGGSGDIAEAIHHQQGHFGSILQSQVGVNRINTHKITALGQARTDCAGHRAGGQPVQGLWFSETVNNLGRNGPRKAQPIVV